MTPVADSQSENPTSAETRAIDPDCEGATARSKSSKAAAPAEVPAASDEANRAPAGGETESAAERIEPAVEPEGKAPPVAMLSEEAAHSPTPEAPVAQPVEPTAALEGKAPAVAAPSNDEAGTGAAPAIALPRGEPASPLGEALAALDRRDYATARRLFVALGRTDAAEAIDTALAALDRKDYATAQGLFEALKPSMPAASLAGPAILARAEDDPKRIPPLAVVPAVRLDDRAPPPKGKRKRRGSGLLGLAACSRAPRDRRRRRLRRAAKRLVRRPAKPGRRNCRLGARQPEGAAEGRLGRERWL